MVAVVIDPVSHKVSGNLTFVRVKSCSQMPNITTSWKSGLTADSPEAQRGAPWQQGIF